MFSKSKGWHLSPFFFNKTDVILLYIYDHSTRNGNVANNKVYPARMDVRGDISIQDTQRNDKQKRVQPNDNKRDGKSIFQGIFGDVFIETRCHIHIDG